MFSTRRTFNQIALMAAGAGVLLRGTPAIALAGAAVALQPLASQTKRLLEALRSIGEPLSAAEEAALRAAFDSSTEADGVSKIQQILDEHVLLNVQINPEDRVTLTRGRAKAQLVEQGWATFLVKVSNDADDTSGLNINCQQAGPMGRQSNGASIAAHDGSIGAVDPIEARNRWIAINMWDKAPMQETLSGLAIEYRILQIYSRDHGQREATFRAQTSAGSLTEQYPFFYSLLPVLFDCLPSKDVSLRIHDENGMPTVASLLITDALGRVYPAQGKRALPDLWFERRIYRQDGEAIRLPAGAYSVEYGRGPEYLRENAALAIGTAEASSMAITLNRWVKPAEFGYYSGDTHIHAAGCAHYDSPSEGVTPEVMYRQVQGEALDIGDVLTWGPGFYYQRQFFSGHVRQFGSQPMQHADMGPHAAMKNDSALLRYDLEISGFPSSHCGHLVLLRLAEQNYPGAPTLDDWPSWNIPILRWAKAQGAVVGYAHSGFGLVVDTQELPNYLMPRFDGIGANEYIVDVTHGMVDFISTCDTLPHAELNIWYHTLNCGFRTTLAGETDFPCLTDDRVGEGRSYVKLDKRPTGDAGYGNWISGIKAGHSYVGDGRSHLFDFKVHHAGGAPTTNDQLAVAKDASVQVTAQVCARLEPEITEATKRIANSPALEKPQWHLERARIGETRKVTVELVVNGIAVQQTEIDADGSLHSLQFDQKIDKSSWIALRVMPSSHTNPIDVLVDNAPIRASVASAQWCRKAVDVCWAQKSQRIRPNEMDQAKAAYDHARSAYERIIAESKG